MKIIQNLIKIFNLDKMKAKTKATLFVAQLVVANADSQGRLGIEKKSPKDKELLEVFDKVSLYFVQIQDWLEVRSQLHVRSLALQN